VDSNGSEKNNPSSELKPGRRVSHVALSLLFSAAFVSNASAMQPVVNDYVAAGNGDSLNSTIQDNINNGNNNNDLSPQAATSKPSSLRQLDVGADLD
jgi:hypothetical protein